jgi:hypothetical protein
LHTPLDGFNGAVFFVDVAVLTDAQFVPTTSRVRSGRWCKPRIPAGLPAFIGDKKIRWLTPDCPKR